MAHKLSHPTAAPRRLWSEEGGRRANEVTTKRRQRKKKCIQQRRFLTKEGREDVY